MRRTFLALTMSVAAAALPASAFAKPKPVNAVDAMTQVSQAERDFDAYTHLHGYTQGFYKYSAPGAINFNPQPFAIHEKLAEDLKGDASDKPSKLRWAPYWIGIAGSRDLAWDLGPWWIEGSDAAGWFFTVWQRQDDGNWLWVLDGGAGSDTSGNLPAGGINSASYNIGVSPTPETSAGEAMGFDDRFNAGLASLSAPAVYQALGLSLPDIAAGDDKPPATSRDTKNGESSRNAALAARPRGLRWTRDGMGTSAGGDMVYTYGRAVDGVGAFKGHYVRVWHKLAAGPSDWVLAVDIYQSARD